MGRLLVVEENQDLCEVLCELLVQRGLDVVGVSNGVEAIQQLKSSRFDIVLSDISMPRLNGIELLKIIKVVWPQTRVFLMTGDHDIFSQYQHHLNDAEFVFLKGRNHNELFSRIEARPYSLTRR